MKVVACTAAAMVLVAVTIMALVSGVVSVTMISEVVAGGGVPPGGVVLPVGTSIVTMTSCPTGIEISWAVRPCMTTKPSAVVTWKKALPLESGR